MGARGRRRRVIARRTLPRPLPAGLPLAALIDCVFLLIIYFMLSGTLERAEADLNFSLPGLAVVAAPLPMPDTPLIEIDGSGRAHVNGQPYDEPSHAVYRELASLLHRYAQGAAATQSPARVLIAPSPEAPHWAIVRVMDACSLAGIGQLAFATTAEGQDALLY